MGVRFRKSIKLGCGVRVNLSRSGIGYSIGGRGFRTTVSPKGRVTSTVTIPRTGLSYTLGSSGRRSSSASHTPHQSPSVSGEQRGLGAVTDTTSADVSNFQPAEYNDLLKRLQTTYNIRVFAMALLISSPIISSMITSFMSLPKAAASLIFFIFVAAFLIITHFAVVDMDYEMDSETKINYENYCAAWGFVDESNGKWQQITSIAVTDRKYHAGANQVANFKPLKITHKLPGFMKTNVNAYYVNMHSEKLIILPDKLIIIRNGKIGAINYDDINIEYSKHNIIGGTVCPDSEIVGHTWKYVNRNGGPDKRFKDNARLNICKCGKITLKSSSGLNVVILLSNNKIIDQLKP